MILEIAGVVIGQMGLLSVGIGLYHYFFVKNKVLNKSEPVDYKKYDNHTGLIVETNEADIIHMNTDQHLKLLKSKYPEAANDYKNYHSKCRLKSNSDRHILRLICAVEAGDLTVKITNYHISFSNGDQIWIANKYYSYGNLCYSRDNEQCVFSCSSERVSLYTFLRIVHFEETYFDPVLKFKEQTIKVT